MDEKPREILCDIIRDYGRTVVQEPKRCRALLLDLCGEHRREINVLMSAMDERIASDLLNPPSNVPHAVLLPQLTKRLHDDTGIATEYAQWAVESWALALGVITSVPTAPKPAPQPAPAPAPKPAPKPAPAPKPTPTPPPTIICPNCSTANDTSEIYCQKCTHQLHSGKKCRHCGYTNVPYNASFCPRCGKTL